MMMMKKEVSKYAYLGGEVNDDDDDDEEKEEEKNMLI